MTKEACLRKQEIIKKALKAFEEKPLWDFLVFIVIWTVACSISFIGIFLTVWAIYWLIYFL